MPRAIWKGAISFGLVTVPVALHSATDPKAELAFRLLHKTDQSPVEYKRFCKEEDEDALKASLDKGRKAPVRAGGATGRGPAARTAPRRLAAGEASTTFPPRSRRP